MKKYLIILGMAVTVIACSKEPVCVYQPSDSIRTITLTASLPQTKVSVDVSNGKVTWTGDDAIAVYDTEGKAHKFTIKDGIGSSNATFECTDFEGDLGGKAVYPYEWAGDNGTVVIPRYRSFDGVYPAVMASKIESIEDGSISPLYFNSLMAIMEFTLQDVPAYACAFKLYAASGKQLNGTYTLNDDCTALADIPDAATGTNDQVVYFPYKTAYGAEATVKILIALPDCSYPANDLRFRILDGDETIVARRDKMPSSAVSAISSDAYIKMPVYKVRDNLTDPRDNYVIVQKVKWAKGNLRANAKGSTGEGWQEGWNVFDEQWESIYLTFNNSGFPSSGNYNLNNDTYKKDGDYVCFDNFSWGDLGRAARVHNQQVISSVGEFSISGKIFGTKTIKSTESVDISQLEEITDNAQKFAGLNWQDNPGIYGDLAYWASKGQYRMPSKDEIVTLYSNEGKTTANKANTQAGYYKNADGVTINGILFTTKPSWQTTIIYNKTAAELTDADLESGLFLPKTGMRLDGNKDDGLSYSATVIKNLNNWGAYWCGNYGGRNQDYENCARHIKFPSSNIVSYGYTTPAFSYVTTTGDTRIGNAIRPVYIPESERK